MNSDVRVSVKSDLACNLCRKNKSRCDRQLPACSFCMRAGIGCSYPARRLKPGPKLGSTQRRCRARPPNSENKAASEFRSGLSHATLYDKNSHDRSPRSFHETDNSSHGVPERSPAVTNDSDLQGPRAAAINFAKAISLSWFLHPSHEASSTSPLEWRGSSRPGFLLVLAGAQTNLTKACDLLRMSIHQAQSMIDLFFEMVAGLKAMSLFHQPTFRDKICAMEDCNHLIALFSAIFSLSSRFCTSENLHASDDSTSTSHQEFHTISLQYIHTSLEACTSSAPPLCLLQAITLAGFYKLVHGVYGPAWRLVGTGVRIAYELRLHMIDYNGANKVPTCDSDLKSWIFDEERRRCWWALWEMDLFASTIQRAPTSIDWAANQTYLPVSDECWFSNSYQGSCFLQGGPEERFKRLKASGNENSVAWTNLFGSLMHDGRMLCQNNMQGILSNIGLPDDAPELAQHYSEIFRKKSENFAAELSSLVKTYQNVMENLPATLSYTGEPLSFALTESIDPFSVRRMNAGKYSIHMMSASACYMIYQNYVFADIIEGIIPLSCSEMGGGASGRGINDISTARKFLHNYLKASDMVLGLLVNCPEDHVRYVNPYYASTVWIAAALQIFKRTALRDDISDRTERQYALLRQAYLQYSQFWKTPLALLQNLDSLEARLETRQKELEESYGCPRASNGDEQQIQNEAFIEKRKEAPLVAVIASDSQHNSRHDRQAFRNPRPETSQLSLRDLNPASPLLAAENMGWATVMSPGIDNSADQDIFAREYSWPDEQFMGDLAWYSTDVMASLSLGYTA